MTVPVAITVPDSTSTSCTALSRAPSHGTGMYFIYKILALTVYTAILSQLFTSTNQYQWYKLISFLCITPIVKYMTLYKKAKTDQRMMKQFIYTTITDSCGAIWMLYYVPRYFGGAWLGITPVLTTFIYMAIEALEYVLLDWGSDSTYVVKLAPNPADNMLVIVICTTYYFLGIHSNFMEPPTIWSFPKFIILWILLDFIFGICHHYCHHVPAMWKKHMLHHQYKREDLNSFANFYAEFTDSWFMNVGYLITAIGAVILGGDAHLLPIDAGIASVLTHSKYCNQHMMSMWMWEYDAIDLLFERTRLANYHNAHHNELNKYISLVGFFSDDFFLKYAPDLSTYFPQAYQTPKKVGK